MGAAAADLLRRPSRLRKLSLFAAKLGSAGARAIADRLGEGGFVSLMELELSACDIGTDGMVRLFAVLEAQAAPALEVRTRAKPGAFPSRLSSWCPVQGAGRSAWHAPVLQGSSA